MNLLLFSLIEVDKVQFKDDEIGENFYSSANELGGATNRYIVDDKGYEIITLTASCGLMLKFEWPLLLPDDPGIKKLSKNTKDIDEYIVDISNKEGLCSGISEIDGGVTVHNACHARAQNMGIKARDMLKLIPNIKLDVVERCAGHGGTFGVMKETYNLATKVGRPTIRQIDKKKNKYMASDCPLAGKHLNQLSKDIAKQKKNFELIYERGKLKSEIKNFHGALDDFKFYITKI